MAIIYRADNFCEQGDHARALEEVNRALAIQREILQEGHIDFGRSWTILGKILTRLGEPARGEEHLRNALALRAKALKPGHTAIAATQSALGECLGVQKRFDEAEPLLLESHTALNKALGENDPRTQRARRRLVALYEAWGKPEIATKHQPSR
jgi:eukaryotic-like serine/threonine-protein kinase